MESNFIEKYVIDELESLKKENKELKEKLKVFEKNKTISFPTLGVYYYIYRSYGNVDKSNYEELKKAYEEKDFDVIRQQNYGRIESDLWNYEIHVGKHTLFLKISLDYTEHKLELVETANEDDSFETLEEAQQGLLDLLKEELEDYEREK